MIHSRFNLNGRTALPGSEQENGMGYVILVYEKAPAKSPLHAQPGSGRATEGAEG